MRPELTRDLALALPLVLVALSRAARHPWACTIMAASYAAVMVALSFVVPCLSWALPAGLPLLLVAPGLALDLLRRVPARYVVLREGLAVAALLVAAVALVRAPIGCPWCQPVDFGALVAHVSR